MATSSSSPSSTPLRPAAAGSANPCRGPFHDAEQPLAETREDLRAVARKLSSCEDALEGRGAYLGITDAVREGRPRIMQKKKKKKMRHSSAGQCCFCQVVDVVCRRRLLCVRLLLCRSTKWVGGWGGLGGGSEYGVHPLE